MASEAPRIDPQRSALHHPPPGTAPATGEGLTVRIDVRDPEVLAELRRYPEGPHREEYLRLALRIGVLSLRMASGSLDLDAIKRESSNLVESLRQLLQERQQQISSSLAQVLGEYLDPAKGKLETRLAALTRPGGELESLLRAQVDGDSSVLARTLTAHVGEQSKLFRMLSPEEAGGLRAQVQGVMAEALEAQRRQLLAQFSLDEPGSAMRRLADTLQQENQKISREFSLDKEDSALSRMTRAIEEAQRNISKRLTLDDEASPLSVLDRAMKERVEEIQKRSEEFQREVRQLLEGMATRRQVEARSTLQGLAFEEAFGRILQPMAEAYGDLFEACHNTTGAISRSKKGDFVSRLGEESGAPEAGIVWEAKSSNAYSLKVAREELGEARRNREAQFGVFVWEVGRAPRDIKPLQRFGNDLVIVWDAEDPSTDIRVEAAYSIARALAVRAARSDAEAEVSAEDIDRIANALEQKLSHFADMRIKSTTIAKNAEAVLKMNDQMESLVVEQIHALRGLSATMRQRGGDGAG